MPWVQAPERSRPFWKACHPGCLTEGNCLYDKLDFLRSTCSITSSISSNITSNLTTPPYSCGRAESTGHGMTHWISMAGPPSISNQIKIPGNSSPPPPSLLSQLEYSFWAPAKITLHRKLGSWSS